MHHGGTENTEEDRMPEAQDAKTAEHGQQDISQQRSPGIISESR